MQESPYRSPQTDDTQIRSEADLAREPVRRVARYQRAVIYALLSLISVNVLSFAAIFGGWGTTVPLLMNGLSLLSLAVMIFAIVAVFLLARELINVGVAVVCAVLMIVPLVSLIVLVILNQKAISYLRDHRVPVGFLGAKPGAV